jgi:hypothetical protein
MAESREAKIAPTNDGRGCRRCAGDSNRALLKEKVKLAQILKKWTQQLTWYQFNQCSITYS